MKTKQTIPLSGKFQLGTAATAFALMLTAYFMDIYGIYGSFLWPEYFVESTLCGVGTNQCRTAVFVPTWLMVEIIIWIILYIGFYIMYKYKWM